MPVTPGYKALMSEIRIAWDGGDQWGSALSNLFGIASVAYVEYDEVFPEFTPGIGLMSGEEITDYPDEIFQDLVRDGTVSLEDMERVYTVLNRFANLLPEDEKY